MLARHAETTKDGAEDATRRRRDGAAVRLSQLASLVGAFGYVVLLAALLGWWAVLAVPAYLCAIAVLALMVGGSRLAAPLRPLLAVALATASMSVLVLLIKLTGLV